MSNRRKLELARVAFLGVLVPLGALLAPGPAVLAQTTLTMSSWVSPQHHLTSVVLQG
jgi:hypothetical protein